MSAVAISLRPEPSCLEQLLWRLELPEAWGARALADALTRCGWQVHERDGLPLSALTHPQGHRLLIVPTTGRVQLRLLYLVSPGERPARARGIVDEIEAALI